MTRRDSTTRFIILAGLPGTGKTALANALAKRLGGIVLSKDRVRAALFSPHAIDYSAEQDDFCMSVILTAAQRIAAENKVPFIFLDGRTFSARDQVQQVVDAAGSVGAGYSILHLHCPESVALERIARDRDAHLARNRDSALYFRVKSRFEPITLPKFDVDTSRPLEECVDECAKYLNNRDTEA